METHSSILAWSFPLDRGAWWATVHGVAKSRTQLTKHTHNKLCAGDFMIWAVVPHQAKLWCPMDLAWALVGAASDFFSEAVEIHDPRAQV